MKRYMTTKKKSDKDGKTVYGTTYYPEIPLKNDDRIYRTTTGDRLDNLAHTFYQDVSLWWIIAKANGIRGIMALKPGTLVRIPGNVSEIIGKFKNINKLG
jgi:hypothetical protein